MPNLSVPSILILASLTSCAMPAAPGVSQSTTPLRLESSGPFVERNYKLGERSSANVGEPLVRVREYYVSHELVMRPSNDFTFDRGVMNAECLGLASCTYPVCETTLIDGVAHHVLAVENERLLIGPDGTCSKARGVANRNSVVDVTLSPPTTFKVETNDTPIPGVQNFELVYSGIDGSSLKLLYREYSREDVARTAFFQELSYDKAQSTIVFRSIKLRVDELTPDGIAYTVLEDGLPADAGK